MYFIHTRYVYFTTPLSDSIILLVDIDRKRLSKILYPWTLRMFICSLLFHIVVNNNCGIQYFLLMGIVFCQANCLLNEVSLNMLKRMVVNDLNIAIYKIQEDASNNIFHHWFHVSY